MHATNHFCPGAVCALQSKANLTISALDANNAVVHTEALQLSAMQAQFINVTAVPALQNASAVTFSIVHFDSECAGAGEASNTTATIMDMIDVAAVPVPV